MVPFSAITPLLLLTLGTVISPTEEVTEELLLGNIRAMLYLDGEKILTSDPKFLL
jgi:hypothetical protein